MREQRDVPTERIRAIRDYRAQYKDPIRVPAGAMVHVGDRDAEYPAWCWCTAADGRQGWVPVELLGPVHTGAASAPVLHDYNATELSVTAGDILEVVERRSDWIRARTNDGRVGWVPVTHVAPV